MLILEYYCKEHVKSRIHCTLTREMQCNQDWTDVQSLVKASSLTMGEQIGATCFFSSCLLAAVGRV